MGYNGLMPRTCTICAHSDRANIDRALVEGKTYRDIAARFDTSTSALVRHKESHMPTALVQAKHATDELEAGSLFDRLKAINGETLQILREARESGSPSTALSAVSRIERQLELEGRLLGQLNNGPKVAVGISLNQSSTQFDFSSLSDEELIRRAESLTRQFRRASGLDHRVEDEDHV